MKKYIHLHPKLKNPLIALGFSLSLIAAGLIYLRIQNPRYQITQISPNDNQTNVTLIADYIVTLNRTYQDQFPININFDPPINGSYYYRPDQNQIYFTPTTYWQPNTTYTATLFSPRLSQTPTTTFTTISVPSSFAADLNLTTPTPPPPNPNQPTSSAISQTPTPSELDPKFQLISTLPYETDSYILKYVIVADHFLITPKIPEIQAVQDQAFQYIASFGITDPQQQLSISTSIPLIFRPPIITEEDIATPSANVSPTSNP